MADITPGYLRHADGRVIYVIGRSLADPERWLWCAVAALVGGTEGAQRGRGKRGRLK